MSEGYIKSDDIYEVGQRVPYEVELVGKVIDVQTSDTGTPSISVTLEVVQGEYKGVTVQKRYWMKVSTDKKGSPFVFGLGVMKGDAKAVGSSHLFPPGFTLPINLKAVRKAYHDMFANRPIHFIVHETSYTDKVTGEIKNGREITFLKSQTPVTAHTTTEDEDED